MIKKFQEFKENLIKELATTTKYAKELIDVVENINAPIKRIRPDKKYRPDFEEDMFGLNKINWFGIKSYEFWVNNIKYTINNSYLKTWINKYDQITFPFEVPNEFFYRIDKLYKKQQMK